MSASPARFSAVVPALDEETAIGAVVSGLLAQEADEVIVVDGGSRDATAARARAAGARVVTEPRRGYGLAVQAGIAAVRPGARILLFVDGDGSDRLACVPDLVGPIARGEAAFVHGSRLLGPREPGALGMPQIVAGRLAGILIRITYGVRFTDMSPFRAIRRDTLDRLGMREESYGWNLEMLMRVAAARVPCREIAAGQRARRGGASKVSGNLRASLRAAWVIARTFVALARTLARRERSVS
ncbi:glycosyltransferase family 2 protein [Methylobacterium nigriterrae]|uniref:glycosyltransferase family 2 protein n=1 Tax=Methylobacterium nigriterrae TaxID=3127512 RepID=UPI003013DE3A